ncbi:putative Amino acid ABC transporter,periplasmic amino acid-binding protein [Candidatus Competibacter denitrificans Run_A_D11]|uniref:Amino acid ABC transporter,periplasmic amino acid-binding protein n=1 Tax=Candidatus Competibacter denitrificans Run_A_D11 TaxID=1400863 RepID=W6M2C3_9GAMM|nr:transporter substrate-binding domain-containing protein [Candidatus Competibacter denitrificans]CDI01622.1 putative Amino acid ABC transporter,periplasmic amino acid-binding protein [Candidatus Competibacter denitrificans Run_A_D11]HRC69731.1 transporter substrate-binding domain-containing protein [Candidatus Competibacter denitrificans]
MTKFSFISAILIFSFSLVGFSSYANTLEGIKKNGTLKVCTESKYMPFAMLDKQNQIIGFDADMAGLIAKELGVQLQLSDTPWADIITALLDGKCEIIMGGMTITDERRKKIDFSDSYISIGQTVLIRKELSDKIKSYRDLNDSKYKVASKAETTGEAAVKQNIPNATYSSFKAEQDGVAALIEGKIDAFVYDSPSNAVAIARQGSEKLVFLDQPFTLERLGWGVRKGDAAFVEWLNGFVKKINKDGIKYKLYQKWFKNSDWFNTVKQ